LWTAESNTHCSVPPRCSIREMLLYTWNLGESNRCLRRRHARNPACLSLKVPSLVNYLILNSFSKSVMFFSEKAASGWSTCWRKSKNNNHLTIIIVVMLPFKLRQSRPTDPPRPGKTAYAISLLLYDHLHCCRHTSCPEVLSISTSSRLFVGDDQRNDM